MAAHDRTRVVLTHDWLTGMRGGEKVLEIFGELWPDAPLLTLLHQRGSVSAAIEARPIQTSVLNWLPRVQRYYRYLLPLMPWAAARWHVPPCDLVVSSSHCVAKGVRVPQGVPHICYCYTPMRYAWHGKSAYFGGDRGPKAWVRDWLLRRLRDWDQRTAADVTHFIAISQEVQQRIRSCYDRDSVVIYPPVDTDFYQPAPVPRENYYLVVSAFAPYKRLDLPIAACQALKRPLVIIGQGQDAKKLKALAGANVTFLGWQSNEVIRDHFRRCRALLFPGVEDFGIVPVEAQACGAPVIAFDQGGARETVLPPESGQAPTGLWFQEQSGAGLVEALQRFERLEGDFAPSALRANALRFNAHRFRAEMAAYVVQVLQTGSVARQAA